MQVSMGNPKTTPPQIVNRDQYYGDHELFVEAVEQNMLQDFLKLAWAKPKLAHWVCEHIPQPSRAMRDPVIPNLLTLELLLPTQAFPLLPSNCSHLSSIQRKHSLHTKMSQKLS